MLQATNITKHYSDKAILENINFSLNKGEIAVIIGPSGGGKSTLLRTLCLLEIPEKGEIIIDDKTYNFLKYSKNIPKKPYPDITIVFQQLFLWPHLTNRANITLSLKKENKDTQLETLIEKFSLKDFIDKYPNESSLGQKQRIALARALILNPKYLLLDEITASLDVQQIQNIRKYLIEIKNNNIGIVFVTHLISLARLIADKVYFLSNGKIVESGGREILFNPKTPELVRFLQGVEETIDIPISGSSEQASFK